MDAPVGLPETRSRSSNWPTMPPRSPASSATNGSSSSAIPTAASSPRSWPSDTLMWWPPSSSSTPRRASSAPPRIQRTGPAPASRGGRSADDGAVDERGVGERCASADAALPASARAGRVGGDPGRDDLRRRGDGPGVRGPRQLELGRPALRPSPPRRSCSPAATTCSRPGRRLAASPRASPAPTS